MPLYSKNSKKSIHYELINAHISGYPTFGSCRHRYGGGEDARNRDDKAAAGRLWC